MKLANGNVAIQLQFAKATETGLCSLLTADRVSSLTANGEPDRHPLCMVRKTRRILATVGAPLVLAGCFQELTSADGGSLQITSGNNQLGVVSTALPQQVRVRAVDQDGLGIAGRTITFSVDPGNGSVSPLTTVTDISGNATATWTLGPTAGEQRLLAGSTTLPAASISAIAELTLFDVDVRFLTNVTEAQRTAFHAATTRWRRIVTGDLSDVPISAGGGQCLNSPALNETIDDLVIFVAVEPIDGPRGTLASAGPCFVRTSSNIPLVGGMRFDEADLATLEQSGDLEGVILHEMGHIIGVGTLWEPAGLLADPADNGGTDPHFTGTAAINAFDGNGGSAYTGGKVPVEDTGGAGTRDGHWRESILNTELMTGFLDAQQLNPLSRITVASLEDVGYTVNLDAADAFTVTIPAAGAAVQSKAGISLLGDIYDGPLYRVTADGSLQLIR